MLEPNDRAAITKTFGMAISKGFYVGEEVTIESVIQGVKAIVHNDNGVQHAFDPKYLQKVEKKPEPELLITVEEPEVVESVPEPIEEDPLADIEPDPIEVELPPAVLVEKRVITSPRKFDFYKGGEL
jgi:hypothetical protein